MSHYFITGLPRSRTAWLANYLTWGDTVCLHDALAGCSSIDDFCNRLARVKARNVGHSDPANVFLWRQLAERFPDARWIVIRRDPIASSLSMSRIMGQDFSSAILEMQREQHLLTQVLKPLVVGFEDLDHRLSEIRQHVAPGMTMPPERESLLRRLNVQIEPARLRSEVEALKGKDYSWVLSRQ